MSLDLYTLLKSWDYHPNRFIWPVAFILMFFLVAHLVYDLYSQQPIHKSHFIRELVVLTNWAIVFLILSLAYPHNECLLLITVFFTMFSTILYWTWLYPSYSKKSKRYSLFSGMVRHILPCILLMYAFYTGYFKKPRFHLLAVVLLVGIFFFQYILQILFKKYANTFIYSRSNKQKQMTDGSFCVLMVLVIGCTLLFIRYP